MRRKGAEEDVNGERVGRIIDPAAQPSFDAFDQVARLRAHIPCCLIHIVFVLPLDTHTCVCVRMHAYIRTYLHPKSIIHKRW